MDQNELRHYGVLGMKWGVRRNPSKAYAKSSKKSDSLEKKLNKTKTKSAKADLKLSKYQKRFAGWGLVGNRDLLRATKKSATLHRKVAKLEKKNIKWSKAMANEFANVKKSDLSKEAIDAGRRYLYMLDN